MSKKSKQPQKSTVTILTVKHVSRARGEVGEQRPELSLAFASRERAINAIKLHLTNPDANTTINIRTLDVISDE